MNTSGPQAGESHDPGHEGPGHDDHADHADHAIVLGAGIAGLLAAKALRSRFSSVTLVERDRLPREAPAFRPGVPHSRHLHILWEAGMRVVESLLPGVAEGWWEHGARMAEAPKDYRWLSPVDWFGPLPGARMLMADREVIEWAIRREVLRDGAVTVLERHEATGLTTGGDGAVTGVRIRRRGPTGDPAPEAPADARTLRAGFVVDATGRGSRAPEWLTEIGRSAPAVTRYDAHLAYATRTYRPAPEHRGAPPVYVQGRTGNTKAGVSIPVDGDRWVVTLFGLGPDAPTAREEDYLPYARDLRSPLLYERLRNAEFLSPVFGFRGTANERVHYERTTDWPPGLLVLGDAACRFNPVYGQGMTVAALGVRALARALDERTPAGLRRDAHTVQRAVADAATAAWTIATTEDLRHPGTAGPAPTLATRFSQAYMTRVMAAANKDPEVCREFFRVFSLSAPPSVLMRPTTLLRVLSHARLPAEPGTAPRPAHDPPRP
ncbi:NAD(P)/FAD-dependent oxidoreductase (plasmid) [Streptomyces sp. BI20]|uniref:NAD(P)/FAD-dependent oxidoreductase n=1 Tax=Streptomyces sp. BI20 TaxID=3403460 RepID=UPI003C741044